MKLTSNFFEIFAIPVAWQVDSSQLQSKYLKLQQEFHPDRYASSGDTEKRLAVQTASLINQAYDTLKSPLKRAQYLLELKQIDASQDSHITSDGAFLMEQIELREALSDVRDSADPFAALDSLRNGVESSYVEQQNQFQAQYQESDFDHAFNIVAKMQFSTKLLDEIEQLEAELEDL
ncbi:Fe-S protein assembly co-chaperone HscB [Porticoccaceae bacterium]|nr:Fe-S protein assembly co-chaperone HscB [Porticoccaceae bacterium]